MTDTLAGTPRVGTPHINRPCTNGGNTQHYLVNPVDFHACPAAGSALQRRRGASLHVQWPLHVDFFYQG